VALNNADTTICEQKPVQNEPREQRIPLSRLPKLVWIGSALFAVNVVIGVGMLITPTLEADVYGSEVRTGYTASAKPSPFTEVVDTRKHQVRLAAKARPVTFVPAPVEDVYASLDLPRASAMYDRLDLPRATRTSQEQSQQLDIPRASRATYQQLDMRVRTEAAVYRPTSQPARLGNSSTVKVYEGYDMPRATSMPRSTERAVHGSVDVAPRRTSERVNKVTVIN
jgi:hypothetical protein